MLTFIAIAVVVLVAICLAWLLSRNFNDVEDALTKLGVQQSYQRVNVLDEKLDTYLKLKDQLRKQFGKSEDANDPQQKWMSQLPDEPKARLKYFLMQRVIGDVAAMQKVDSDARGYWRLFSKGMITTKFWNSVKKTEEDLGQELDNAKFEALCVEPAQNPQGIISEAMHFVMTYGNQHAAHPDSAKSRAEIIEDMVNHLPGPGSGPPGRDQRAGMPLCGMPPGSQQPVAQVPTSGGDEKDGYTWKQDSDELEISVCVPANAVKSKLKVAISTKKLGVQYDGATLVEGQLYANCCPEGSTWTISKGRVVISLEKAEAKPWNGAFCSMG